MASFKKNEEGVSAVIGVILMVAITVILAAVIAAFVFQLGNQLPQSSHTVGANVVRTVSTPGAGIIEIKSMSGDLNMLKYGGPACDQPTEASYKVVLTSTGGSATACDAAGGTTTVKYSANQTGLPMYFKVEANQDVTVIAQYTDGTTSNVFSGKI